MTSFRITITPNRRAAGRFVFYVHRTLQRAFIEEKKRTGITQAEIARKLGVDRSVITRELHGSKDIGLGRIAEYAWALGREIRFDLLVPEISHGDNKPEYGNAGFIRSVSNVRASTSQSVNVIKLQVQDA